MSVIKNAVLRCGYLMNRSCFFFQAEDGIRDLTVTGVQTCALPICKDNKQQIALEIAAADRVSEGPVCALTAVELCSSYGIRRDEETGKPDLKSQNRKGLSVYQYWMDPVFGFMSLRLQTWFPFPIHIYLNGREWLSRQMDQARIAYRRQDNCFTWIEDLPRAQALMHDQREVNWGQSVIPMAERIHPLLVTALDVNYP